MIVLDASAALAVLFGSPPHAPSLRARLARPGETVHVPHLFDLEVLAAIRRHILRRRLSTERANRALDALGELRATRYSHAPFRERIWKLRTNVTPYDAAYVALAEVLKAPLVTLDAALAEIPGVAAEVELHG